MSLKKILDTIKKNKTFLISTHVNPDPDALASELALAIHLKAQGKQVYIVNEAPVPARFLFLPGIRRIRALSKNLKVPYDVAIVLDFGDLERAGRVKKIISPDKPLINIDHHVTNDAFGSLRWVYPKASSTAEVLFELFTYTRARITRDMAILLYLGIMTDTGSFRYESTGPRTHAIVSELLKFKFSISVLYRKLYESVPLNDMEMFTKVVSHFDSLLGGKVICVELKRGVVARFSQDFDLRDKIFGFLRTIKGVEVVFILTEDGRKKTRVNLRSQGKVNVARLAHHFNGGGHHRASGRLIENKIQGAKRKILQELRKVL